MKGKGKEREVVVEPGKQKDTKPDKHDDNGILVPNWPVKKKEKVSK